MSENFVALDFETADYGRDSACALGLIKVADDSVIETKSFLIRPPRPTFQFTWLHGIKWADVEGKPTFAQWWPEIETFIGNSHFLVAHNASFDRGVLETCCRLASIPVPPQPFFCTVQLARKTWNLVSASLPSVCQHLGLSLENHHDAESDAMACARIVLAAKRQRGSAGLPWKPLKRRK